MTAIWRQRLYPGEKGILFTAEDLLETHTPVQMYFAVGFGPRYLGVL